MTYQTSLYIFRRDLRLHDNTALIQALASSKKVIPCFIFDQRQIGNNDYKSDNCLQFMVKSLQELDEQLREKNGKLYFFYGQAEEIIKKLISECSIEAVFVNRDYTRFSQERDRKIKLLCQKQELGFHDYADVLLHEPEQVHKADGKPYTVFTPFFNKASSLAVKSPAKNARNNYYQGEISFVDKQVIGKLGKINNHNLFVKGGRKEGLSLLKNIRHLKDYALSRDIPSLNATSKLSAHNKFGTISIREVYFAVIREFGEAHMLIRELFWRDFFTHIAFHFKHVFGHAFHEQYDGLKWKQSESDFLAWCEGRTGFPIVDAGMRELNATGYMHNRVRMITASFLVKDLHIDWRAGEKYFAQKLVDYDPAVNNGNWQWAASTGCDAQPYFRIFNPWLQQKKFDADCLYIKKWLPELAKVPNQIIHQPDKFAETLVATYPLPMLDHVKESRAAVEMYRTKLWPKQKNA